MLLDTPLDVALGLIFTYLVLSLIVSAMQEALASLTNMRSKQLYRGLWRLLNNAPAGRSTPAPATSATPEQSGFANAGDLFHTVWNHGLIDGLGQRARGPSYVSAKTFSIAMVDVLSNGSRTPTMDAITQTIQELPDSPAKTALAALANRAGGDLDAFHTAVSSWFDEAMDRISGTYKRLAQKITFACGLLVVVLLNVNTFQVARTLWDDPSARHFVADEAHNTIANQPAPSPQGQDTGVTANVEQAETRVIAAQSDLVAVPIGWQGGLSHVLYGTDRAAQSVSDQLTPQQASDVAHLLGVVLGWLMTGLAISLGAPFWFDTLQRFVNLRSTGPQPASSTTTG